VIRQSAAALILLVAPLAAHAAEKNFDRTFNVSPGGTLTIDADGASIKVSGSDSNQVVVRVRAKGSEKDLDQLKFEATQSGDSVDVTLRHREKGSWFSWGSWNSDERIEVTVPRRYAIDAKTGGGNIELADTTGTATLRTSGGNVSAKNLNGDVELRTSGGSILADSIRGAVDADTSGGDVRLMRIDGKIKGNTSGGNVRCSLVGANREISATTSGGSIEIILPKAAAGNVRATTSGGSISSDLSLTASSIKEGRIEGVLNGGGPPIYAHTSGGSISLRME
jgi:hypothetical protein